MQLDEEEADPREIAARPGETGNETGRDRVGAASEDDRDRRGCVFRREYRREAAAGRDQIDLEADEVGGQCG